MPAVFANGDRARALFPALQLKDGATVWTGTVDPTSVATLGTIGDLYLRTGTPGVYQKITTSATDTNWTKVDSGLALAAVGSSPNANAASLSSDTLTLQPADGTNPGVLTSGSQTIGGAKTFNGAITASNLSGTNTGDITLTAVGSTPSANGASLSGQALTIQPADATHPGALTILAQTLAGAKTFSTAPILSSLTASLPLQLDASKNITATAIDLSGTQATGTLAAGRFPALTGGVTTSAGSLTTTVVTNANLTGPITSSGNATSIASQTGTGNTFVMSASPTITGTLTYPTPFTLGATSVTSTGTQLNYLASATGTTGTTNTNIVFSTSPSLTTPTIAGGALSGTFSGAHTLSGAVTISDATASTTTGTGALIVTGGTGIGGQVTAGGALKTTVATSSTNTTTGSGLFAGGVGIVENLNVGGTTKIAGTVGMGGSSPSVLNALTISGTFTDQAVGGQPAGVAVTNVVEQTSGTGSRTGAAVGFFANNRVGANNTQAWTGTISNGLIGASLQPRITSGANTFTVTNATALYGQVTNSNANATISSTYGAYFDLPTNAGTMTATCGVAIADQTRASNQNTDLLVGTVTIPTDQNWAVAVTSTYDSRFAGNVRVGGTTAPTVAMDVTGALKVSTTTALTGNLVTSAAVSTNSYDTSTATSGTITASANTPGLLITGAGGTTLTIKLPSSPIDGQQYWVASQGAFTTTTWQDSGGTAGNVIGGPAAFGGVNKGVRFVYGSTATKWFNIG